MKYVYIFVAGMNLNQMFHKIESGDYVMNLLAVIILLVFAFVGNKEKTK